MAESGPGEIDADRLRAIFAPTGRPRRHRSLGQRVPCPLVGKFAPTVPVLLFFLVIAVTLRITTNPRIHAAGAISIWLLLTYLVAVFAMRLGVIAEAVRPGI